MPQPALRCPEPPSTPPTPAEDLVARVRSGDRAAFADLYATVAGPARAHAMRFVPDADADDVVANTLIAVWRAIERGGGPTSEPLPYVLHSVRTEAWRVLRAKRAEAAKADRAQVGLRLVTDEPALTDPDLARAFRSLNRRHQRVLWWTVVEGRSAAEIGAELGISANAASALALRARQALRRAYLALATHRPAA